MGVSFLHKILFSSATQKLEQHKKKVEERIDVTQDAFAVPFFMYIVKLKLRFMKFLVAAMLNGSDSRGGILGARRWDPKTLSRMEKFSSLNCSSVDGDEDDEPAWPFPFPLRS
jgi:hypothetical protein